MSSTLTQHRPGYTTRTALGGGTFMMLRTPLMVPQDDKQRPPVGCHG
jgi:hypothetical protein